MKVRDVMTRDVRLITPDQTVAEAAKLMADCDTGALPVREGDRLIGVITDRDIAVRAVAQHKSPDAPVREVMSSDKVLYCYDDEDVEHVAKNMAENKVRRLPALNRDKRLVGIVSIGDLAHGAEPRVAGEAIADICQRGGAHSQTAH
jgi:CBS domain-containing protein